MVDYARAHGGRVLDYGCGGGEIVEAARAAGIDMVGADVFYAANDSGDVVRERGLLGKVVFEIRDGKVPFDDATFDLVVSNQVLEHVEDIDAVVAEVARLLRRGGTFLALFPSREAWREGHCEIPFAHRVPTRLRTPYIFLWRVLGFGSFKEGRTRRRFAAEWNVWLERYTHYRSYRELRRTFDRHFAALRHLEPAYMAYRLRARGNPGLAKIAETPLLRGLMRFLCTRLAGLVIELER